MTTTWNLQIDDIIRLAHKRAFGNDQVSGMNARDSVMYLNMAITDLINRGAPLSTLKSYTQTLTPGTASYTLDSKIIDVWDVQLVDTSTGSTLYFPLKRISVDEYAQINNKQINGRPGQWVLDRQIPAPILSLYLIPNQTSYSLAYHALTRQADVANLNTNVDLSYRFSPSLVSGLAYYMLIGSPKDYASETGVIKLQTIKQQYDQELNSAFQEDRERTSTWFTMDLGFNN